MGNAAVLKNVRHSISRPAVLPWTTAGREVNVAARVLVKKPGIALVGHVIDRVIEVKVVVVHAVHGIPQVINTRERVAALHVVRVFKESIGSVIGAEGCAISGDGDAGRLALGIDEGKHFARDVIVILRLQPAAMERVRAFVVEGIALDSIDAEDADSTLIDVGSKGANHALTFLFPLVTHAGWKGEDGRTVIAVTGDAHFSIQAVRIPTLMVTLHAADDTGFTVGLKPGEKKRKEETPKAEHLTRSEGRWHMRGDCSERDSSMAQLQLFGGDLPEGFVYRPAFISADEQRRLVERIEQLSFAEIKMHGVVAKRRAAHFGRGYEYESRRLASAAEIPDYFLPLRARVAVFADRDAKEFAEVLVTDYPAGAGIGWHRDAPAFDIIVGISLLSECTMQFRPWPVEKKSGKLLRQVLEPRSAYILRGPSRTRWQHHIAVTKHRRLSLTFRTLWKSASDVSAAEARH
jgi:alkylated DNA repair dioxygenase AlkB